MNNWHNPTTRGLWKRCCGGTSFVSIPLIRPPHTHDLLGRCSATPPGPTATVVWKCGTDSVHPCESGWKTNGERGFALRHPPRRNEVCAGSDTHIFDLFVMCKITAASRIETQNVKYWVLATLLCSHPPKAAVGVTALPDQERSGRCKRVGSNHLSSVTITPRWDFFSRKCYIRVIDYPQRFRDLSGPGLRLGEARIARLFQGMFPLGKPATLRLAWTDKQRVGRAAAGELPRSLVALNSPHRGDSQPISTKCPRNLFQMGPCEKSRDITGSPTPISWGGETVGKVVPSQCSPPSQPWLCATSGGV